MDIFKCYRYEYLRREVKKMNNLTVELNRGKWTASKAHKSVKDVVERKKYFAYVFRLFGSSCHFIPIENLAPM